MDKSPCLAVVGKGGVGKTTIAAFTIRYLLDQGVKPLLAVDADPSSCLAGVLGVEVGETVGGIREDTRSVAKGIPDGIPKQQYLALKLQEAVAEAEDFDLLTMGRPEGPGCYCFVNNVLRDHLDRLTKEYRATVIDCEAGLEHLSRRTTRDVQTMFLVADPTVKALQTLNTVLGIISELDTLVQRKFLILNRVPEGQQEHIMRVARSLLDFTAFEAVGVIPQDHAIFEAELEGRALLDLNKSCSSYRTFIEFMARLDCPLIN
ncbi:MAG: AAA family ATPase [bacterium]